MKHVIHFKNTFAFNFLATVEAVFNSDVAVPPPLSTLAFLYPRETCPLITTKVLGFVENP